MKGGDKSLVNLSLSNALILLKGKPEPGGLTPPETGHYIQEQNPDDSMTEQVSHVYTHLNNMIVVMNQHAAILNTLLNHNKQALDGRTILAALSQLGGQTADSHGELTEADRACLGVKGRLAALERARDEQDNRGREMEHRVKATEDGMDRIREVKIEVNRVKTDVQEMKKDMTKKLESTENNSAEVEARIVKKCDEELGGLFDKMGKLEKEVAWKISDCSELLKLRPTEASVETNLKNLEQKIQAQLAELMSSQSRAGNPTSTQAGDNASVASMQSFNDIYEKIHHFENKQETLFNQLNQAPAESVGERIENMHLRFEDQQTMIHQTQKRLEELYELLRETDRRVLSITSKEETLAAKLDMVVEMVETIKEGIPQPKKKGDKGSADGNGGDGKDDGSGGGGRGSGGPVPASTESGGGLSLSDKGALRRVQDGLDDLTRLLAEYDKEIKAIKGRLRVTDRTDSFCERSADDGAERDDVPSGEGGVRDCYGSEARQGRVLCEGKRQWHRRGLAEEVGAGVQEDEQAAGRVG
jgi:hypothetical protein